MATAAATNKPPRIMHTMIRVGDLKRSIEFYQTHFGMSVIRTIDVPEGKYTNVFIGYGEEKSDPMIGLTYNYGVESSERGTGFGHVALPVPDITAACDTMRKDGATHVRQSGPS